MLTYQRAQGADLKKRRAPMRKKKTSNMKKRDGGGNAVTRGISRPAARPKRSKKALQEPRVIRRTPHLDLPTGTLRPGALFIAEVFVDTRKPRAGEKSRTLEIEKEGAKKKYKIDVWMAGSRHFTVEAPNKGVLKLDRTKNRSESVTFKVRVADSIDDPSGAVLFAYFSYQGRPCGQVSQTVNLTESAPGVIGRPRLPEARFTITTGVPADITVEVTDPERTTQHLLCRVSSRLLPPEAQPPPQEWHLSDKSEAVVKGYMKEFVNDENHRAYSLIGAGIQLYKAAPDAFKKVLWNLIDRGTPPTSILITSDEPNIPWELMVPSRRGKDGTLHRRAALGVEFNVGRWIRDDHLSPPASVPITNSFVIAPTYVANPNPLRKSVDEVALVLRAVPGLRVDPANLANIMEQLAAGGRSLLHFVCHGADEGESGVQAIFLDGGEERLTSLEVSAIPPVQQAFKKRPMVFLNACEVGRPTVTLNGIGGFAAAFLELGAAAVIAPLWSVKDTIAFEVAQKFYTTAVTPPPDTARKGFAAAMREIRALAYDDTTGEDTYAAYCFYGDPNAVAR
jgi:hypothetical protein